MRQTVAVLAALFCACGVRAQTPSTLKEGTVYNRPVYFVANDKLEVAVVKQGGSMLRILIQGDTQGLSPYGNPEMVPSVPDNRKLQGPSYDWRDGLGDRDKRPPRGNESNDVGLHDFIALNRLVGAEPDLAIDSGPTGSPTYPLDVLAAFSSDRKNFLISVVNPTEEASSFTPKIGGVNLSGPGKLYQIAPPSFDSTNEVGKEPAVKIVETAQNGIPATVQVPPFSISLYELEVA